jgi:hypothetical protein
MNTGGRLAGVTPPAMPAVDDTSFAAAKSRVETALGFVKSLTRAQVDGAEGKVIAWTGGGNDRKMKGNDYLQQFAPAEFFLLCNDGVDRLEILSQVVWKAIERAIHHIMSPVPNADHVAIGCSARDSSDSNRATGTADIFNNNCLTK